MSAPNPPTLADVMNQILAGIQTILYEVAKAVADNASVIATVVVVGLLAFFLIRYGGRIFRGVTGWLRGLL